MMKWLLVAFGILRAAKKKKEPRKERKAATEPPAVSANVGTTGRQARALTTTPVASPSGSPKSTTASSNRT